MLEAPPASGQGQHGEVSEAHPAAAARAAGQQRRSYAGAVVMVLHGLDGRLLVQHEGRSIATQEAPPSPVLQRTITGSSPYIARRGLSELTIPGTAILPKLATEQFEGNAHGVIANPGVSDPRAVSVSTPPRKPTFLQRERVEGDTESEAQRTAHSQDSKGVRDQPSHGEEIRGNTSQTLVPLAFPEDFPQNSPVSRRSGSSHCSARRIWQRTFAAACRRCIPAR